jgi:hypothetical protein
VGNDFTGGGEHKIGNYENGISPFVLFCRKNPQISALERQRTFPANKLFTLIFNEF